MTPRTESVPTAGAVPPADPHRRELLQSVVDVARAIFGAAASSVFLLDEEADELVFQAVSGQGEEFLVGRRFPAGRGIAGWVATSGEPMVVDDLTTDSSFDRALAESTEFVPSALMAAPLISDGRVLGVLEVLDPSPAPARTSGNWTCSPCSPGRPPRRCGWRRTPRPVPVCRSRAGGSGPGNGRTR